MKIYSYCIRILDSATYALFVLMELSEGDWDKEIKSRFMKKQNYTEKELINILYQLSSSLLYSEQNLHISHRDIKPQNVLVFPGGKYKIADFGEAKETKIMKQRNTLRGTELFMSPALYNGLKHDMNDVSHNPFKSGMSVISQNSHFAKISFRKNPNSQILNSQIFQFTNFQS